MIGTSICINPNLAMLKINQQSKKRKKLLRITKMKENKKSAPVEKTTMAILKTNNQAVQNKESSLG